MKKKKIKIFKSHFWYSKRQRNGIVLLIVVITFLQVVIVYNSSRDHLIDLKSLEVELFQKRIDSLKALALEKRKPKIFPFNPNFISDFKGSQLGMSIEEIDRLHAYRAKGYFINSEADFKRVTQVSDSLLNKISPYFKFPDWVNQKKSQTTKSSKLLIKSKPNNDDEMYRFSTRDLNKITFQDLIQLREIDGALAGRIIKYRSKLGGFYFEDQLYEVFNISDNQVQTLLKYFSIADKPIIKKQNLNTLSFKELLKIPYMNYELCKQILDYRDMVAEIQNIDELKLIKDFPIERYDRIVLYLEVK